MTSPVTLSCGHNFNGIEVIQWFGKLKSKKCVLCDNIVHKFIINPNQHLKSKILIEINEQLLKFYKNKIS